MIKGSGGGPAIRYRRLTSYLASGDLGPQLIRTVAASAGLNAIGIGLTFLVGVQLARGLGVAGYGVYGIAMAVFTLAGVVAELGVPKLVLREIAAASATQDSGRMHGVLRWAQRTSVRIGAMVAGATALGAFLLIEGNSPVRAVLWSGAPLVLLGALANVRGSALQGLHHVIRGQVGSLIVRPLLFSILLLILFQYEPGAGPVSVMFLNVITAGAALLLAYLWLRTRLPPRPAGELVLRGSEWRAASIPMALADGLRIGQAQAGILLLGVLAIADQAGLFRIATSIVAILGVPIAVANGALSPISAKLFAQGDFRRLQLLSTRSARFMFVAVTAMSLPFLLWGSPLIAMVFGEEFAPAAPALVILCVGTIIGAALGRSAMLLLMTGHERRVSRAMFVGLALNLMLLLLLIPLWGEEGAAIATSTSMLINGLLTWRDAKRLLLIDSSIWPTDANAAGPRA